MGVDYLLSTQVHMYVLEYVRISRYTCTCVYMDRYNEYVQM